MTHVKLGIVTLRFNLFLIQLPNSTRLDSLRLRQLASPRLDPSTKLNQVLKVPHEVNDDFISVLEIPCGTLLLSELFLFFREIGRHVGDVSLDSFG